jgi:hypothetical protein
MPHLYGNPTKDEIRAELRKYKNYYREEALAHQRTRDALRFANCKIEELEAKVQRMEQKAREITAEAAQDINDGIVHRVVRKAAVISLKM